jgi:CxxC-x17-CxxC domain-containing protein
VNFNQDDRPMFDTVCSECGKETQVPFQPTQGRPVYCRDCFAKNRPPRDGNGGGGRGGDRQMFETTCAKCGNVARVPFQPTEGKPVYCRDCFAQERN